MKPLILLFTFLIALPSTAQVGVKIINFRPTGELGKVMKKSYSGEIMYMSKHDPFEDDSPWVYRYGFSFIALKPRLDTFPTVSVLSDGNGTTVMPGYETFSKYNMFLLFAGADLRYYIKEKFTLYPGMDILFGGVDERSESVSPMMASSFDGGNVLIGLRFRAGFEYRVSDRVGVFMEASRGMYLLAERGKFNYIDYGLGTRINLFD